MYKVISFEEHATGYERELDNIDVAYMNKEKIERTEGCRVIACCSQKGGVGKTNLALNLGVAVAGEGFKVLLVDMDPQSSLTKSLGYRDKLDETIYDLMDEVSDDENRVPDGMCILNTEEGVDLIPSSIDLASMEVSLLNTIGREFVLKQIINILKKDYDMILIDCPPSLSLLTINALASVDEVIIPVEPSYLPMEGLQILW